MPVKDQILNKKMSMSKTQANKALAFNDGYWLIINYSEMVKAYVRLYKDLYSKDITELHLSGILLGVIYKLRINLEKNNCEKKQHSISVFNNKLNAVEEDLKSVCKGCFSKAGKDILIERFNIKICTEITTDLICGDITAEDFLNKIESYFIDGVNASFIMANARSKYTLVIKNVRALVDMIITEKDTEKVYDMILSFMWVTIALQEIMSVKK